MIDHWLEIANSLRLSDFDQKAIDAFRQQPKSRNFLPLAEILAKNGEIQESIQLLMFGLDLHPNYAAARVILANNLLHVSNFREALDTLDQSPVPLWDNKTAQILKFELNLLLGREVEWQKIGHDMSIRKQLDGQALDIYDEAKVKSFDEVRHVFLNIAKSQGLAVDDLPKAESRPVNPGSHDQPQPQTDEDKPDPVLVDRLISGFYVSPITEIFNKPELDPIPESDNHDLDAVTLAKIYRQQHRYHKALDIYQKLLFMAPNNDMFKKQVEELRSLRDDQKRKESQFDPELVYRLDKVQDLESKIRKLHKLLSRLDEYEKQKPQYSSR